MSPEGPIVDCGPFCSVGFSRAIDKSEFSHSLNPYQTFKILPARISAFSGQSKPDYRRTQG